MKIPSKRQKRGINQQNYDEKSKRESQNEIAKFDYKNSRTHVLATSKRVDNEQGYSFQ